MNNTTTHNTATQRRTLRFETLDDMLTDAQALVEAEEIVSTGNWNLPQALMHLALSSRMSMDGAGKYKRPFVFRIIGPMIKRRILKKGMRPGYNLPESRARLLVPRERTKLDSAWDAFQRQTERLKECQKFHPHPVFGEMTRDEWLQLTLRHAELHLSFHRPAS